MDWAGYLRKGIEILMLNGKTSEEVSVDEKALTPGIVFIVIGGLASAIGALFMKGGASGLIMTPIMAVVASFVGIGILHLIALLLGGKANYMALYRACAISSIIGWANIIPFVGGIVSLWGIPVTVIILENVHKLDRTKAIIAVLIPVVAALLFGILVMGTALMFLKGPFMRP